MTFWNILCIAISVALALALLGCAVYILASSLMDEYFSKKEKFYVRMLAKTSETMTTVAKQIAAKKKESDIL